MSQKQADTVADAVMVIMLVGLLAALVWGGL